MGCPCCQYPQCGHKSCHQDLERKRAVELARDDLLIEIGHKLVAEDRHDPYLKSSLAMALDSFIAAVKAERGW